MKQTAVEWYEKEINSLFEKYEAKQISPTDFLIMKHNIFYPAKQMEKDQIERAYHQGIVNEISIYSTPDAEHYYKQTYEEE